jgi:hypothetical protein
MPEFTGSADKLETFQIKSLILSAAWLAREAAVGATVGLEVRTCYVAHGGPITVTIKNREGKTLQKVDGVVYADFFRKQIQLGQDAVGGVFFEAELSKHGLKAVSPRLAVGPQVRLFDPAWKKKDGKPADKIKRDDDLSIEVKTENIAEGAEARVTFKEKVSDTLTRDLISVPATVKDKKIALDWRFEYPRDTAAISSAGAKRKTAEKYHHPKVFFEASSAGASVKGPEGEFIDGILVEVVDGKGKPAPKQKVKITLPDGASHEGETDDKGLVFVEEAAPGLAKVELVLPPIEAKPQPRKPKPPAKGNP